MIGGVGYKPDMLREMIQDLKADLRDPSLPFGVDLLLPKVGDGARATNHDYTKGTLSVWEVPTHRHAWHACMLSMMQVIAWFVLVEFFIFFLFFCSA